VAPAAISALHTSSEIMHPLTYSCYKISRWHRFGTIATMNQVYGFPNYNVRGNSLLKMFGLCLIKNAQKAYIHYKCTTLVPKIRTRYTIVHKPPHCVLTCWNSTMMPCSVLLCQERNKEPINRTRYCGGSPV